MTAPRQGPTRPLDHLTHPRWDPVWVVLIGLVVAFPLIRGELPAGYDAINHMLRIELLVESLRAGLPYPRWMPDLHLGYGAPLFTFYAPAAYYLAASLVLLGMGAADALRWTTLLLLAVSGLGVWRLVHSVYAGAPHGRRWAALVGAFAYGASPYLVFNAYTRTATPELLAQVVLPWALCALRGLVLNPEPGRFRLPLAVSLAGVVISHTVSIVITPIFMLLATASYGALLLARRGHAWQTTVRTRLPTLAGAGLLALALSAWFWLPLVVERRDLGTEQYLEARSRETYESVPIAETFTTAWPFPYNTTILQVPISAGFVALAGIGLGLGLRRRHDELLVYTGLAALALVGHWPVAQPALEASGVTRLIQFPWRLQTWIYLPMAVLVAGVLPGIQWAWPRRVTALLIVVFLVVGGTPVGLKRMIFRETQSLSPLTRIAFAEGNTAFTAFGLTADQEFLPVWVREWPESMLSPRAPALPAETQVSVRVLTAGPLARDLEVAATQAFTLTFSDYYFSGWQATVDGQSVPVQPAAISGLLALPLPAGDHRVRVSWSPTPLHVSALALTLGGFLVALGLAYGNRRRDPAQVALVLVWVAPIAALAWPPPPALPVDPPASPHAIGLDQQAQLLAVRANPIDSGAVVETQWWVRTPLDAVTLVWRLRDRNGVTVQTVNSRPYFDQLPTTAWPAPGLVDDRIFLPWPAGQPAARYTVTLCTQPAALRTPTCNDDRPVTTLDAPATGPALVSASTLFGPDCRDCLQPWRARAGDLAELVGIGFLNDQQPLPAAAGPIVIRPQDSLEVVLAWQSLAWMDDHYHSTVFVTAADGSQVSYSDHLWTTTLSPLRQWMPGTLRLDYHTLYPRQDAPSGLYPLRVGVFDLEAAGYVDWQGSAGEPLGETTVIADIKWLNPPSTQPQTPLEVRLADFAWITGVTVSAHDVRPGETLTITVYARADRQAPVNLTRFVHLTGERSGLIAQADGTPGEVNPTGSWQPGEVIADEVGLTLPPDAAPGVYRVLLGYYDPATGVRASIGAPDDALVLTEVAVK